jgi:hypothetical protein
MIRAFMGIRQLTQTKFAKQQGIDPSYFSLHKQQLLAWQQGQNQ